MSASEFPKRLIDDVNEAAALLATQPDGHRLALAVLQMRGLVTNLHAALEATCALTARAATAPVADVPAGCLDVGDLVEKVTGDYKFPGTVISVMRKLNGVVRYAVEDDRGAIHIFNAAQIAPRLLNAGVS